MKEFFKRRAKGDVPDYICELFDKASAEPDGERKTRTTIVNKLFTRSQKQKSKKSWSMDMSKPYFQEVKKRFVFSVSRPPTNTASNKRERVHTMHLLTVLCVGILFWLCLVKFANRCLYIQHVYSSSNK